MRAGAGDILELVGELHAGVADEDCWLRGLDRICDNLGGQLLMGSLYNGRPYEVIGHRMLESLLVDLRGPLGNPFTNPWVASAWQLPLRRAVTTDAIGGQARLRESRLWTEAYERAGVDHSLGVILERQPDRLVACLIHRAGDDFTSDEQRWFDAVAPHLARAWRVRSAVEGWKSLAAEMAAVLDQLERGVVITGETGAVRYANRAAERMLSAGDGIDATGGHLRGVRPSDTQALTSMIERATRTSIGRDGKAVDALALPRSDDRPALAVVAEPLAPSHGERLGQSGRKGAILFISDSAASSGPPPERLQLVYSLTAAEAQLAARLTQGVKLAAAAAAIGITANTAKTHLKAIYEKIGVNKQTDFIRRVIADVGGLADESAHGPPRTIEPGIL